MPAKQPTYPRFNELIGNTPLVNLSSLLSPEARSKGVQVLAKAEFMNPGLSIKDRIMRHILDKAEASGELRPGMTVVAASSGNTGAATAMLCAMRGYKCIITTNQKCSKEKMDSIKAYGAELIVGPEGVSADSPKHYMNIPLELIKADPQTYFDVNQYENPRNPEAHYATLGPEIWKQTAGTVTHFVAAGSTGGTVSGVGRYLKDMYMLQETGGSVKVVMPDPVGSIFKQQYETGSHGKASKFLVEGVGKDSIPGTLNFDVVDEMFEVSDQQAFDTCHLLAQTEGLFVGGSSGLNVYAAVKIGNSAPAGATIVTVMPDIGVKYLSKVYNTDYLTEHKINPFDLEQLSSPQAGQLQMAQAAFRMKSRL